jgi:hypothetical protein
VTYAGESSTGHPRSTTMIPTTVPAAMMGATVSI